MNPFFAKLFLICLIAGSALSLHAQSNPADTTRIYNLKQEVVVTSLRNRANARLIPQKIDVLDSARLAMTPATDLSDALKKTAGLDIVQYPGLLSGISIRGYAPQLPALTARTLLLIDGRPAGTTNLAMIDLNGVERVEVLKGPASALYGAQAMGGVINVISRRSEGPVHGSAYVDYGSWQTLQGGLTLGGSPLAKLPGFTFDLSLAALERSQNYKLGHNNFFRNLLGFTGVDRYFDDGTHTPGSDKLNDGQTLPYTKYKFYTGALRLGYKFSDHWRLDVHGDVYTALNVFGPSDITSGYAGQTRKNIDRAGGEALLTGTLGAHTLTLKSYVTENNEADFNLVEFSGVVGQTPYLSFRTRQNWFGFQAKDVVSLSRVRLTYGLDYAHAKTTSFRQDSLGTPLLTYSPDYALVSTAAYLQAELNFLNKKLLIVPGIRAEAITYDGLKLQQLVNFYDPTPISYIPARVTNPFVSPSLGLRYTVLPTLQAVGSVGRGFITPDAFNVAGYSSIPVSATERTLTQGNGSLRNEKSVSAEVGLRYHNPQLGLSGEATFFATEITDRITTQTTGVNEPQANGDTVVSRTTYINANKAHIRGLELGATYDFGATAGYAYSLRLFANLTRLFVDKEEVGGTLRDMYNVAPTTLTYGLSYDDLHHFRIALSGRYVARRLDVDYNTFSPVDFSSPEIRVAASMTLDLVAAYTFLGRHTLTFYGTNLTDENYYEKRGFNLPGRTVSLRYTLRF